LGEDPAEDDVLAQLVDAPIPSARAAVEHACTSIWILDPQADLKTRIARTAITELVSGDHAYRGLVDPVGPATAPRARRGAVFAAAVASRIWDGTRVSSLTSAPPPTAPLSERNRS